MKNEFIRTDLAVERGKITPKSGIGYERRSIGAVTVETVTVPRGHFGAQSGRFVTLSSPVLGAEHPDCGEIPEILSSEIRKLSRSEGVEITKDTSVLIVGIGNRAITSDALGPLAADGINATGHVKGRYPLFDEFECSTVFVISPGVAGQTGIDAAVTVEAAVNTLGIDLVLAIDSLCARSATRLMTTLQLSTCGISPGSGIGNSRTRLSKETLGVPTVSIGVPTVVDSSTLIYDAITAAGVGEVSIKMKDIIENGKSFFVCPKECDVSVRRLAKIISKAVNITFATDCFEM